MVKLRSQHRTVSEQKCIPSLPSLSPSSASYESFRLARIAENQARLAELGVKKHLGNLKEYFAVTKRKYTPHRKGCSAGTPVRRSERIKSLPTPNDSSKTGGVSAKSTGYANNEITPRRRRNTFRDYYEDSEERRPANAPLIQCSPAELQLSPEILSRRCDSKSRGSIYDSLLGITCHFCRQKKLCGEEDCERCGDRDVTKSCIGKTDCSVCHSSNGVFCRACLKVRYGEDMEKVRENMDWMCPHCSEEKGFNPYWICNSSFCLKSRKIPPTGILIFKAREMGYESVAHYLADVLKRKDKSN